MLLGSASDPRTFHQRAREEGRWHEDRVAADLSEKVFEGVFPSLARAIADAAPKAPLQEVREAALILLYRLLFIFYAEDRELLLVRDDRYKNYGLRIKSGEKLATANAGARCSPLRQRDIGLR